MSLSLFMAYVSRIISPTRKNTFLLVLDSSGNIVMELRGQGSEELDTTGLENLCGLGTEAVQVGLTLENLKTNSEPVVWEDRQMAYCISS